MAADSAILAGVRADDDPPTIRFYRWQQPAVTIGRFQNAERTIRLEGCRARGIPIVRRPTGGRGILHGSDQTVSVVVPASRLGRPGRSVRDSYRLLSSGFIAAFSLLGVDAASVRSERLGGVGDCFAAQSTADVIAGPDGAKLVGSAQRREGGAILQQSSIRYREPTIHPSFVFAGPVNDGEYPLAHVALEDLEIALVRGFESALGIHLARGSMRRDEWEESARLWSERGRESASCFVDSMRGI